jgi:hypothetical protein
MADGAFGDNCLCFTLLFHPWRAMKTHETRVKSYFRGRNTRFFEEDASRVAHPEQLKRFRDSFAISNGERGAVDFEAIGAARIDYEGQLTLVSSVSDGQFFFNHCSGPDVSLMNYSSALSEFRSSLSAKGAIENAAFCLSVSGYNFHCFLFEILPSLIAFKEELGEADNLILGATAGGSFIEEFNEVLKFHKSIELLPLRSSIEVTNAFAITSFPFRIYPIDILEEIRLRMRQESEKFSSHKGTEICFIGRADRDRNRRNLLNEDAVLGEIISFFGEANVIRPGITKLIETVAQIRDARVIVGMLGGSLAHLVWAHSLELFIEIVPYTYFGATETEELSKIYGFEYRRINSSNVDSDNWAWANQNCDIAELQSVLQSLEHREIR